MKRILVILSPSRMSSECVEWALSAAEKEGGELVAVFILDTTVSLEVQERLDDLGFLGSTPSGQFMDAMRREQERQGTRELERIRRAAEDRNTTCRTMLLEGDFLGRSLEVAEGEEADAIFVARRERPRLSRLVSGSQVNALRSCAPCRVLVVDGRGREGGGEPHSGNGT